MYQIAYNGIPLPTTYATREEAINELTHTFGELKLDVHDIAYWPSVSARGYTKIEIVKTQENF